MSKRIILSVFTTTLLVLLASLLAACSGAEEQTVAPPAEQATPVAIEGETLLQERCTRCHDLGRVEQARKTEAEWKATVERMVGKGAQLSQAEQEAVTQYLAEIYGP